MTMATLERILAAAQARQIALAPETSGYLALAVAQVTSAPPLEVDDASLLLGEDGLVTIVGGGSEVSAEEAAASLRARLGDLVSASTSPLAALADLAAVREQPDMTSLVAGIEGALVPLNRGAAQRALARLAREVGRLPAAPPLAAKAKPAEPVVVQQVNGNIEEFGDEAAPAAAGLAALPSHPGEAVVPSEDGSWLAELTGTPLGAVAVSSPEPEEGDGPAPAVAALRLVGGLDLTPTLQGVGEVGLRVAAAEEEEDTSETWVDAEVAPIPSPDADPMEIEEENPHDALTIIPGGVAPAATGPERALMVPPAAPAEQAAACAAEDLASGVAEAAPALPRRAPQAEIAPATKSDVSELLASFRVTDNQEPRAIARSLKELAGIDATALPPAAAIAPEPPRPALVDDEPEAEAEADEEAIDSVLPAPRGGKGRWRLAVSAALLAAGALGTGLAWHYRGDLSEVLGITSAHEPGGVHGSAPERVAESTVDAPR